MIALFSFEWVRYLGPALGAVAFVLIGVAVAGRLRWRLKIRRQVVVAERTAQAARTKGFIRVVYDPAIIFGHPAPFSDSEIEVLAEAVERSGGAV